LATATLDWSQCPGVESIPGKVSGAWVFKDTRMPVATVFENLEAGLTVEEVMEEFFRHTRTNQRCTAFRGEEPANASPPKHRPLLPGHIVVEATARGWDRLSNGALLQGA
jgi:uncharacterized protein (DUF433 family)